MLNAFHRKIAFLACFAIISVGLFCTGMEGERTGISHCPLVNPSSVICDSNGAEYLQVLIASFSSVKWAIVFVGFSFLSIGSFKMREESSHSAPILKMLFYSRKNFARRFFHPVLELISKGILQPRFYESFEA
jgi:hypothetical protein